MIMQFKKNLLITLILLVASCLRFYQMDRLTTFGGDQGYDFEQIRNIVVNRDPTLLGPKIGPYNSLGNLYLGPAYYYLLLPSLVLSNFDPLGPEVFTIILSIITIYLTYLISLRFFNKYIAISSALLLAINPFLINQSRSASNPHLTPFFATLAILCLFQTIQEKSNKNIWPLVIGICCGISFQLHYLGIVLLIFCIGLLLFRKTKAVPIVIVGFLAAILPQIIFEIRHNFFVTNLVIRTIKDGNNITSIANILSHSLAGLNNFGRLLLGDGVNIVVVCLFCAVLTIVYSIKNKNKFFVIKSLWSLLILVFISSAFYSASIQPHYLVVGYTPFIILLAIAIYQFLIYFKNPILKIICFLITIQIFAASLLTMDLNSNHGYTMPEGWNQEAIRKTSRIIVDDSGDLKNYNIASTLDGDTRATPYRYLVKVYGSSPQPVEAYPSSDYLYLVTRDDNKNVLEYTVWEVFSLRPFKISEEWQIQNGIRLLRLERQKIQ